MLLTGSATEQAFLIVLTEGVRGDRAARQIGDRNVAGFVHRCQLRQGGLEQLNHRIEQRTMQYFLKDERRARGADQASLSSACTQHSV